MKRFFLLGILIFLLIAGGCSYFSGSDQENEEGKNLPTEGDYDESNGDGETKFIIVKDNNLRTALKNLLEIEEEGISPADMLRIEEIDFPKMGISDLTGLEYALNAKFINLRENQINDIKPLGDLKRLERLILDRNQLSDITAVSGMESLKVLELRENKIEDITAVEWDKIADLVYLDLMYNFVNLQDKETERVLEKLISRGVDVWHDTIEPVLDDW